jgi:glycosyltransferase involved in cell wall biosynthesis
VCWYNAAQALILPSLSEGFGLPALEAMACGTPVIAANLSSLPEVVGKAGLLVDPYRVEALCQGMARVLGEPGLRRALGEKGIKRAWHFSWREANRRTVEIYHRLANR